MKKCSERKKRCRAFYTRCFFVFRLERPYNAEKLSERADVHLRKVVLLEFTEMTVVADNVGGSGDDGAVNERDVTTYLSHT